MSDLRIKRTTQTLRELALDMMREAILDLRFKPGERLIERKLVSDLGVSRTVVREVLRHLDSEGLVTVTPNHGPSVAVIDADNARQIYQLRSLLEGMAVRELASKSNAGAAKSLNATLRSIERAFEISDFREVRKQTEKFYATIFESTGLTVAWEIVRNLNARINVLRAMTIASPGRGENSTQELRRIVQAIADNDPDAAEEASVAHITAAHNIAQRRLGEIE